MLSWPARQSLNMWIGRAADYLEPELGKAKAKIGDLAKDDFGLLIYALYPTTGEQVSEMEIRVGGETCIRQT